MDPLWIDFVNSDWHDPVGREPHRDLLADAAWLRGFLDERGLPRVDTRRREVQDAVRDLRDLFQRLVRTLVERGRLAAADLDAVNAYLAARPVTGRIEIAGDACRVRLVPMARGLDAVLLALVESFAAFLVEGDSERLKLCGNPDCRWVFYDSTRSRTRRWCADSCGNLMKVRKFRKKKTPRHRRS